MINIDNIYFREDSIAFIETSDLDNKYKIKFIFKPEISSIPIEKEFTSKEERDYVLTTCTSSIDYIQGLTQSYYNNRALQIENEKLKKVNETLTQKAKEVYNVHRLTANHKTYDISYENKYVTALDLSTNITNALKRRNIVLIGDLLRLTTKEILSFKGISNGSLELIKKAVDKAGYSFYDLEGDNNEN